MDAVVSGPVLESAPITSEVKYFPIFWVILKTIIFSACTIFILCIPLGDPEKQCPRESKAVAFNYLCNIYEAMSSTMSFTTGIVHKASVCAGCVFVNALYDAKLKFYGILQTLDREDLCRSVCCIDHEEQEESNPSSGHKGKKPCKCKAKCCKRSRANT